MTSGHQFSGYERVSGCGADTKAVAVVSGAEGRHAIDPITDTFFRTSELQSRPRGRLATV